MENPIKLLIVEDSKIDAALLLDELTTAGFNLVSKRVETPEAFLQTLTEDRWDVICSDYIMPRFTALAALKILQESGLDIPFIIVSGSIGEDLAVQALHKGADDYLMKDNLARLAPAIKKELQKVAERRAKKQIEDLLKETENNYLRLVEGVKDYSIFTITPQGIILNWNLGSERILGYGSEEIIGKSFRCFFTPEDIQKKQPEKELEMALSQGRYESEGQLVCKDGRCFTSHNVVTPVFNDEMELTGYSKILRDMTRQKETEERIRHLAEELESRVHERTNQLELVNQELESFTQSVSHDLKAPLRNLAKLSQILLSRHQEQLDSESRQYLTYILESSQQALQLATALLDLSKVTRAPLIKARINLTLLSEEIIQDLKDFNSKRQVEFNAQPDLFGYGDPVLIKIAIQNLLENAWKFSAKNTHATIAFSSKTENNQTVFSVHDNGVGFDQEYSDRLFQPFQRLHSSDEFYGTGVGLATVQRIIHRHGGRVWAKGVINEGATFYFTLPAS